MEALQAELVELKAKPPLFVHSVRLKKHGHPFPLEVTATIDAPDNCSYDVSHLAIKLTIGSDTTPCKSDRVRIEVTNDDLPKQLSSLIASRMHTTWREEMEKRTTEGTLGLSSLLSKAATSFTSLISSISSLLEAYQSVDQFGATCRRWAIIGSQEEEEEEEEAAPNLPSRSSPQDNSNEKDETHESCQEAAPEEEPSKEEPDEGSLKSAPLGTRAIHLDAFERDLVYLTRRYGPSLTTKGLPEGSYSLELAPTDPSWRDHRPPLQIQILTSRGQGDGAMIDLSLSLGLGLSGKRDERQESLIEHQRLQKHLNNRMKQLWTSYVDQGQSMTDPEPLHKPTGPQKGPLRNLLSHLENFIGDLIACVGDHAEEEEEEEEEEAGYCSDQLSDDGYGDGEKHRDDNWWGMSDHRPGQYRSDESSADEEEEGKAEIDGEQVSARGEDHESPDAPSPLFSATTWRCLLDGLRLDEVDAVEMVQLPLQIVCSRCKTCSTVDLCSPAVSSSSHQPQEGSRPLLKRGGIVEQSGCCRNCGQGYTVSATRSFVHSSSNRLLILRLSSNFAPRDIGASLLSAQCFKCTSVTTLRGVQAGIPSTKVCSSCHQSMTLSFSSVSFSVAENAPRPTTAGGRVAGHGRGGGINVASQRSNKSNLVLVVGTPLPQLGTCLHYRHSYRWLRFPCCGMRAPCDLCHEFDSDHPCRWAKSMVCGFCSLEQPVSSQCASCHKKLACAASNPLGKATRFWEGGSGCRDTKLLNKNDPHKWRGKAKTKCMKSARVGPKTWRKKEGQSAKEED